MTFLSRRPGAFKEADTSTARLLATQAATALNAAAVEQRRLALKYQERATGLPNARYLRERGSALIERAAADGQRMVCIVMAVGALDALRLSVGFSLVEEALRKVASMCRNIAGERDLVGRDEEGRFVMLCGRFNAANGKDMADRLRASLGQMAFDSPSQPFSFRAEVGLAVFPDDATDLDTLMARAAWDAVSAREGKSGRRHVAVEKG